MTKTLTENRWFYTENGIKDASWNIVLKSEVIAPVPSYEEYKRLVSNSDESSRKALQLEIATKALKEIRKGIEDFNDDPMNKIGFMAYGTLHECLKKSKQALKEMKGVK